MDDTPDPYETFAFALDFLQGPFQNFVFFRIQHGQEQNKPFVLVVGPPLPALRPDPGPSAVEPQEAAPLLLCLLASGASSMPSLQIHTSSPFPVPHIPSTKFVAPDVSLTSIHRLTEKFWG